MSEAGGARRRLRHVEHRRGRPRWPDGRARPLLVDGSPLLPSAVYAEPDGALVVGRDAVHSARLDPARFEPNPKRRIDDGSVLLGDREVPVADLVAAVLARVAEEWHRAVGAAPPRRDADLPGDLGRDPPRPAGRRRRPGRARRRRGWSPSRSPPPPTSPRCSAGTCRSASVVVVLRLRRGHVRRERGGAHGGRVRGGRGRRARRHRRARRRRRARRAPGEDLRSARPGGLGAAGRPRSRSRTAGRSGSCGTTYGWPRSGCPAARPRTSWCRWLDLDVHLTRDELERLARAGAGRRRSR